MIQTAPLTGAVVVTTPSDVSLEDARKAVNMFRQVRVEVLGLVENMSYLIAPQSGERIDVFGSGGGKKTAEAMGVHFLGELPLDPAIRIGGDRGEAVAWNAGSVFDTLAAKVVRRTEETASAGSGPKITIED
jgi:ATP-binding protein involved in chromosome partitioning